jgi:hypothetical protein
LKFRGRTLGIVGVNVGTTDAEHHLFCGVSRLLVTDLRKVRFHVKQLSANWLPLVVPDHFAMANKILPLLLLCGLMLTLASRAAAQGASAQPPGRIQAVRVNGEVYATVKATGVRTQLVANALIAQGDTVTTAQNASVVLVFSNGATINLAADSLLDIDQFTQDPFTTAFQPATATAEPTKSVTKLKLVRGELVSKVATLNINAGSDFTVDTPVGAAGIRGTTFRIVYRVDANGNARFALTTLEGTVQVRLATGTVAAPPVAVSNNKEIVVAATVTTDAAGNVTVTLPSGTTTTVPTNVSTATIQQVTAAAQVIAQAVATVVIAPTPPSTGATATPSGTNNSTNNNNNNTNTTTTTNSITQPINPTVVSPST